MKRAMLFIDGGNLFHDWKDYISKDELDLAKYIKVVQSKFSDCKFIRTYYFTTQAKHNDNFIQFMNSIPYCEVIAGRLENKEIDLSKYLPGDNRKIKIQTDKGTDVNIAIEMLRHAYNKSYDVAILVSRDADFCSVVNIIKNYGLNVELVLFEKTKGRARELSIVVDNILLLNQEECNKCIKE